jgi:hypothetical protein
MTAPCTVVAECSPTFLGISFIEKKAILYCLSHNTLNKHKERYGNNGNLSVSEKED